MKGVIADYINVGLFPSNDATILYVDDQPSHRLLFEHAFRGDWLVLTAPSAEEGLQILQEHAIFLVVADLSMPKISGIDFLSEVQKVSPQTVRAVLSAYSSAPLKEEAKRKAGVTAFFEKPWDKQRIRHFIDESYARLLTNEPQQEKQPEDLNSLIQKKTVPLSIVSQLPQKAEGEVDARGAKRIFLSYCEPPLRKEEVAIIRRAAKESWCRAVIASIQGDHDSLEKALFELMKE